jgi:hypothetical protein
MNGTCYDDWMAVIEKDKKCWAHCLLHCLCSLQIIPSSTQVTRMDEDGAIQLSQIPKQDVGAAFTRIMQELWKVADDFTDPRLVPNERHDGLLRIIHKLWIQPTTEYEPTEAFTNFIDNHSDITTLARFRMRSHHLNAESLKWGPKPIPRSERLCTCCKLGKVEDELHVMFECTLYQEARTKYFSDRGLECVLLLDSDNYTAAQMRLAMNGTCYNDWMALVRYLKSCHITRFTFMESNNQAKAQPLRIED